MANKEPVQNEEFKAKRFQKRFNEPMGKVRGARFPESADRALEGISDCSDYIRNAVIKQLKEDGLLK